MTKTHIRPAIVRGSLVYCVGNAAFFMTRSEAICVALEVIENAQEAREQAARVSGDPRTIRGAGGAQ